MEDQCGITSAARISWRIKGIMGCLFLLYMVIMVIDDTGKHYGYNQYSVIMMGVPASRLLALIGRCYDFPSFKVLLIHKFVVIAGWHYCMYSMSCDTMQRNIL